MRSPSTGLHQDLLTAYEGVESEDSFADPEAVGAYRRALLERSAPQADFLARLTAGAGRMLEVGCGNGRLLIALARAGVIREGLGLDSARSRIDFARNWARDENLGGLRFEVADVLTNRFPSEAYTVVACITGAFAYFEPAQPGSSVRLTADFYRALSPGGTLCLELYPHPAYRRLLAAAEGEVRLWQELPASDAWRFYLSTLSLDDSRRVLTHEKTFIHRQTGQVDSGRREHLYLYSPEELREQLGSHGFHGIDFYGDWSGKPYAKDHDEVMIVIARK